MGTNNLFFLEIIEWFDETGSEIIHRIPEEGSAEIKYGAQLIVRESQAAIFFYEGKAVGAFGPGRHTLKTANVPLLTKIAALPWGARSPLRAEVYMVNLKVFTNLKWGTRDPVAFKDAELDLVRLRAFGVFNIQVVQPVLFINRMVGTQGVFSTEGVSEYLNRVIVSRFNDYMGETIDTILNLPAQYDELSEGLKKRLEKDMSHFGLRLTHLYIDALTPPPDVQKAIDDRSRMGAFKDMDKLMKMKAAMAMEKASESEGGSDAMGAGMGVMLPAMFAQYFTGAGASNAKQSKPESVKSAAACSECGNPIPVDAKFCPQCGHQQVVFEQCNHCGKNLTPNAKFCPRCGRSVEAELKARFCSKCGSENLPDSHFCVKCGEQV